MKGHFYSAGKDVWVRRTLAAFVVAVHLFPDRFSREEIEAGVTNLLVHAPNHLAAGASLAGHPIQDVFGLGNLVNDEEAE